MNDYERNYLQPDFGKEPKYTECEYCRGKGYTYDTIENELIKEDCPECGATGVIEIEED
jgi:DnaJ-class molecular chaperone